MRGLRSLLERESRAVSYQDVFGSGRDWTAPQGYRALDALGLPAVVGCVRHRANVVRQLRPVSFRYDADGFSEPVPAQPSLLVNPSPTVKRSIWRGQLMISRDLWGNAFGAILARDAALYPKMVDWLSPTIVATRQDFVNGPVFYTVNGRPFPAEDMLLVPSDLNLPGSPLGMAPLQHAGLVELGRRAQEFGADWFRNGAVPSSIIYSDDPDLTPEDAEEIRNRVTGAWRNRRPGVLGSGLKLEHVQVQKNESQFNETINAVGLQVCQVFGVSPEEIGLAATGSSITYANRTDAKQASLDRMNGDLELLRDVLTDALPRPQFVDFDTSVYLRGDTRGTYEANEIAIRSGQLTPDEARRDMNRRPLPAGYTPPTSSPTTSPGAPNA